MRKRGPNPHVEVDVPFGETVAAARVALRLLRPAVRAVVVACRPESDCKHQVSIRHGQCADGSMPILAKPSKKRIARRGAASGGDGLVQGRGTVPPKKGEKRGEKGKKGEKGGKVEVAVPPKPAPDLGRDELFGRSATGSTSSTKPAKAWR